MIFAVLPEASKARFFPTVTNFTQLNVRVQQSKVVYSAYWDKKRLNVAQKTWVLKLHVINIDVL